MGSTVTLTKDYGQEAYKASGLADSTVIDAKAASWIIDNSVLDGDGANAYPFRVYNSPNVTIEGGVMHGEVSLTEDWETLYYPKEGNGNSAAIRVESSPNAIIQDWKIDRAFDGIRIAKGTTNFLIQDMQVTDVRDDVIENDAAMGGTIRVLLDLITVRFLTLYSTRPIHVFGVAGLLSTAFGLLITGWLGFERIVLGRPLAGRPIVLLGILLTVMGLQFVTMGLLGELLVRTYHESQNKPVYRVEAILKS